MIADIIIIFPGGIPYMSTVYGGEYAGGDQTEIHPG